MSAFEIVSRIERRRKWSAGEKAALLAEVEAEGGKVALVARRHRMSESLLYNWRSAWKAAAAARALDMPEFLQLGDARAPRRDAVHGDVGRAEQQRHGNLHRIEIVCDIQAKLSWFQIGQKIFGGGRVFSGTWLAAIDKTAHAQSIGHGGGAGAD